MLLQSGNTTVTHIRGCVVTTLYPTLPRFKSKMALVWDRSIGLRRIAGVKRVDRRRMDELREEVGIQKCLMGRLVKSRMKWAGHVERMKEDRLSRMAYMFTRRGGREREEDHV